MIDQRRNDVLRALQWAKMPMPLVGVVRSIHLSTKEKISWCSVGHPRKGEKCASVPKNSRDKVFRILNHLAKEGLVIKSHFFRRATYHLPEIILI